MYVQLIKDKCSILLCLIPLTFSLFPTVSLPVISHISVYLNMDYLRILLSMGNPSEGMYVIWLYVIKIYSLFLPSNNIFHKTLDADFPNTKCENIKDSQMQCCWVGYLKSTVHLYSVLNILPQWIQKVVIFTMLNQHSNASIH